MGFRIVYSGAIVTAELNRDTLRSLTIASFYRISFYAFICMVLFCEPNRAAAYGEPRVRQIGADSSEKDPQTDNRALFSIYRAKCAVLHLFENQKYARGKALKTSGGKDGHKVYKARAVSLNHSKYASADVGQSSANNLRFPFNLKQKRAERLKIAAEKIARSASYKEIWYTVRVE